MSWRRNRPVVDILTGHWISMTGTALVTLAGFSWLFLLPMHISGHANDPYIGLLAFVALPLMFFTGLVLIPIGVALGRRRVERPPGRRRRPRAQCGGARGIFFVVMTAANLVIASQLSYRAVAHMESVQFCGQTCHVMKPEFTAHMRPSHAAVDCVECHVGPAPPASYRRRWRVPGNSGPSFATTTRVPSNRPWRVTGWYLPPKPASTVISAPRE